MKKFGIVKYKEGFDYWDECAPSMLDIEWHELEDDQASKLRKNIHRLNTSEICYTYVEYADKMELATIIDCIDTLLKNDEEKKAKRKEAAERATATRAAKATEKKRKQLAQLMKELEEG